MPLKAFPQFNKLPLEIRRRVWNLSFAPRVIRVENKDAYTHSIFNSIYQLTAGPVPRLLQVNHESRTEGLRTYTLVASQLPHFCTAKIPAFQSVSTRKIYVDLERDTFYVVKIQATTTFVAWLRRFGKEKYGGTGDGVATEVAISHESSESFAERLQTTDERMVDIGVEDSNTVSSTYNVPKKNYKYLSTPYKPTDAPPPPPPLPKSRPGQGIRNLAFPASIFLRLQDTPFRDLDFLLSIAMLQPHLKTLGVVLDYSKFETAKYPEKYELKNPQPLAEWVLGEGSWGGKWGNKKMRLKMRGMLEGFWTRQRGAEGHPAPGLLALQQTRGFKKQPTVKETWDKWINDETRKDGQWKAPEFVMWGLGKVNKLVL